MSDSPHSCPDCQTPTEPIRLLDATGGPGWDHKGMNHVDLVYAAPEARASFFTGRVPSLGSVRGVICPNCGRILLYGEPHATSGAS